MLLINHISIELLRGIEKYLLRKNLMRIGVELINFHNPRIVVEFHPSRFCLQKKVFPSN